MPARRPAAACGALLVALAVPAAAEAATFTAPLAPCYVTAGTATNRQAEGFPVAASGFTINSLVNLTIDGGPVIGPDGKPLTNPTTGALAGDNLQVNDQGVLALPALVPAPWIKAGQRDFTVTLTQQNNPANVATAVSKVTALDVNVDPSVAAPSEKVRFSGRGFTANAPVYAHYVHGGKLKKTVRMSGAPGVCGTWSAKRKQIPVHRAKTGRWIVQFDQAKKYRNGTKGGVNGVYVRLSIDVRLKRQRRN